MPQVRQTTSYGFTAERHRGQIKFVGGIIRLRLLLKASTAPSMTLKTAPTPIIITGTNTSHEPDDVDVVVADELVCVLVLLDEVVELGEVVTKVVVV